MYIKRLGDSWLSHDDTMMAGDDPYISNWDTANIPAQQVHALGVAANAVVAIVPVDALNDQIADAKAGGGGRPGGGGGGGGGSGLLTTYTSGDPNVANADEFNIQINFSGS